MKIQKYYWKPIQRRHPHSIPWGYEQDKDDAQLLIPIDEHLDALETAKDFLKKQCSSREVARWLSEYTGHSLSHTGLIKRIVCDNERFSKEEEYTTGYVGGGMGYAERFKTSKLRGNITEAESEERTGEDQ